MNKFKVLITSFPSMIRKIGIPLFKKRSEGFEYHERDRYFLGFHWIGDIFGTHPLETFRRGMIDDRGGRDPNKLRPIKGMITTNMLQSNEKGGFELAPRFKKFYSGFQKKKLEKEIERLERELRRRS